MDAFRSRTVDFLLCQLGSSVSVEVDVKLLTGRPMFEEGSEALELTERGDGSGDSSGDDGG